LGQLGAIELYPRGEGDEQHDEGYVGGSFFGFAMKGRFYHAYHFHGNKSVANQMLSIEGTFLPWSADLGKHLLSSYPLPDGKSPIAPDIPLIPKHYLVLRQEAHESSLSGYDNGVKNE